MSTQLVVVPFTIISQDDADFIRIAKYIKNKMGVNLTKVKYTHGTDTHDNDGMVYIVNKHVHPYRNNGIKCLQQAIKNVKCQGDRFQQTYGEIAFITHLLIVLNREKRNKNKPVSKIIKYAISLYSEARPKMYSIYYNYDESYKLVESHKIMIYALLFIILGLILVSVLLFIDLMLVSNNII